MYSNKEEVTMVLGKDSHTRRKGKYRGTMDDSWTHERGDQRVWKSERKLCGVGVGSISPTLQVNGVAFVEPNQGTFIKAETAIYDKIDVEGTCNCGTGDQSEKPARVKFVRHPNIDKAYPGYWNSYPNTNCKSDGCLDSVLAELYELENIIEEQHKRIQQECAIVPKKNIARITICNSIKKEKNKAIKPNCSEELNKVRTMKIESEDMEKICEVMGKNCTNMEILEKFDANAKEIIIIDGPEENATEDERHGLGNIKEDECNEGKDGRELNIITKEGTWKERNCYHKKGDCSDEQTDGDCKGSDVERTSYVRKNDRVEYGEVGFKNKKCKLTKGVKSGKDIHSDVKETLDAKFEIFLMEHTKLNKTRAKSFVADVNDFIVPDDENGDENHSTESRCERVDKSSLESEHKSHRTSRNTEEENWDRAGRQRLGYFDLIRKGELKLKKLLSKEKRKRRRRHLSKTKRLVRKKR